MRTTRVVFSLITTLVLASCGNSADDAANVASDVRSPAADSDDLVLYISNQSFADDPVEITIILDGVVVLTAEFAVEGQHSWREYGAQVGAGDHEISATSNTGASLERTVTVPFGGRRWVVLDYWYDQEQPRGFTLTEHDTPVVFE